MNPELYSEIEKLGAKGMESCMQCGNCAASCPLSQDENTFPRKIYQYLHLGLEDKLLQSPEPWLCYYCGDCNIDCPRGAEPAETMMAVRRWMTMKYDWTGLAKKFYFSEKWEFGALGAVALFVILLFAVFHGPVITDRVSVNTFAPVLWIEIGDLLLATVLGGLLLSNAWRMHRFIMNGAKAPLNLYITEAKEFLIHFISQKRWRKCGDDKSRWFKHFLLVSGYLTMLTLIIVFLRWFQVDDSSWHFTSLFGYYATGVLLFVTVEMFYSRLKKEETMHRYSHLSDYLFLILLFATTLTGIIMHIVRLAGWPMGTYISYVIHLAIAVPMLVIEVPFGKWSHLFYRPFAVFLARVKEKMANKTAVDYHALRTAVGETFAGCMQCGTCTGVCPSVQIRNYSPRLILRNLLLERASDINVDDAAWSCVTCNSCVDNCPRGIELLEMVKSIRESSVIAGKIPQPLYEPFDNLRQEGTPWKGKREQRTAWASEPSLPQYSSSKEYCLFTCCTTAYDDTPERKSKKGGLALNKLLEIGEVSYGSLGAGESCCGDQAETTGNKKLATSLTKANTDLFKANNVTKLLTVSPHCFNAFSKNYPDLDADIQIIHYTELLESQLKEGKLTPMSDICKKVTYHDPCYLGRHNKIYDAPRYILRSIPGLELVEMQNSKQRSQCCGGGGGGAWQILPMDEDHGVIRVNEALETGAEVIATACPYCIRMLNNAIIKLGAENRIIVSDVAELLLQSVEASYILSHSESTHQEEYNV